MRLLPLLFSAQASDWASEGGGDRQEGKSCGDTLCRFCGFSAPGWGEDFYLSGDRRDISAGNLVRACVLCALVQNLARPRIDEESALVWLPEMSQGALNTLIRTIQLQLRACGEIAAPGLVPSRDTSLLRGLYSAYLAILDRGAAAGRRLGTAAPSQLGAALLRLTPTAYAKRSDLIDGLRIVHLGRYYRQGADVYPQLLDAALSGLRPIRPGGSSCC